MEILISFVATSVVAFLLLCMVFYDQSLWRGKPDQCSAGPFVRRHFSGTRKRKRSSGFTQIGIAIETTAPFLIRRENFFDRVLKGFGVAKERQTGDSDFDHSLYSECDDADVAKVLAASQELRDGIAECFDLIDEMGYDPIRLRSLNRRLWIEIKSSDGDLDEDELREVAASLYAIRDELKGLPSVKRKFDTFFLRAAFLMAISIGSLFNFVPIHAFYEEEQRSQLTPWIFYGSAGVWAILFSIFLGLAVSMLRKSSRTPLILAVVSVIGGVGFFVSVRGIACYINNVYDHGAATLYDVADARVEHKQKLCGKHKDERCDYYYIYAPLPEASSPLQRRPIDASTYAALKDAPAARITVMPGALGFPWLKEIGPADAK